MLTRNFLKMKRLRVMDSGGVIPIGRHCPLHAQKIAKMTITYVVLLSIIVNGDNWALYRYNSKGI